MRSVSKVLRADSDMRKDAKKQAKVKRMMERIKARSRNERTYGPFLTKERT